MNGDTPSKTKLEFKSNQDISAEKKGGGNYVSVKYVRSFHGSVHPLLEAAGGVVTEGGGVSHILFSYMCHVERASVREFALGLERQRVQGGS